MNKQKTIDTLQCRYIQEARQNVILRSLVREARVCIRYVGSDTPALSPAWVGDWLERANELLGEEQTPC